MFEELNMNSEDSTKGAVTGTRKVIL
jgi:hypothetical protein